MKSFISQFRKAKQGNKRLILDGQNNRYLVTLNPKWQTLYKCKLIINFR